MYMVERENCGSKWRNSFIHSSVRSVIPTLPSVRPIILSVCQPLLAKFAFVDASKREHLIPSRSEGGRRSTRGGRENGDHPPAGSETQSYPTSLVLISSLSLPFCFPANLL